MRENEREETPDKELFSGEKVLLVDDNKINEDSIRTGRSQSRHCKYRRESLRAVFTVERGRVQAYFYGY